MKGILKEALQRYEIIEDVGFEALGDDLKVKIYHKVKLKCKENAAGALF